MASNFEPVSFESTWKKKEEKEYLRKAREEYLEEAKDVFDRKERKREQARLRGEGTWMLSSVTDRINEENKEIEDSISKKDKKKKKHKKEKKKKSEKEALKTEEKDYNVPKRRDDWMMAPVDLFSGVTRQQLRAEKNAEKEKEAQEKALLDQAGMHERELNPYWKDGGTGLPDEKKKQKSAPIIGDGGAAWLKTAYQRMKQQAEEEGRKMEDLAAERYGSLAKLEEMISDAEKAARPESKRPAFRRPRSRSYERRSRSRDRNRSHSRERKKRRSRSRERKRSRSRSGERERRRRSRSGSRERSRSQSRERRRSRTRSRERRRRRSRSRSRERRSRSHSKDRRSRRSRSTSREKSSSVKKSGLKGMFMKPGELGRSSSSKPSYSSSSSSWRKEVKKPESSSTPALKKEERKSPKARSPSSSSGDSDPSSESEEEREGKTAAEEKRSESPPPVILLSEEEMNKLAAKVMRAQILGNDAQAKELQDKLDAAREAKKNAPAEALAVPGPSGGKKEEEEVVLTRTDRSGMTRPVYESKHPKEPKKGRRKPKKVTTHGEDGERERYFDDDDKYGLKDLVVREKMSTAEDQNTMFARLAGKTFDKTDEDHDLDDVFMTRAAKKQSDSQQEERDRSIAIFEHKKVSSALEKCNRCMEKTPKHLIIAIGIKVYLCLPAHKSLSKGHCLIVPIQHVSSGTSVDEDVWTEIQVFRKGLTRMFQDQGEDVVFMETAMHLRHHPHMAVEVVPISDEVGHMAPIYFKKAIQETGEEWAQNKKLVDLSGKDVRKALPKGFPYFSVDFGLQSGYAHVIEDEKIFPPWFGREIVGGMLDADPTMWRKPHKENFDDQRKKVLEFAAMWKPYDWTQRLKKQESDSDSDSSDD